MDDFFDWLEEQIRISCQTHVDLSTGQYYAFIKVKEYILKHPISIPCAENIYNNHDWIKCPDCGEKSCKSRWKNHE